MQIFVRTLTGETSRLGTNDVNADIPIHRQQPVGQSIADPQWQASLMRPNTPQISDQLIRNVSPPSQLSVSDKESGGGHRPPAAEGGSLISFLPPPEPPRQPREWHKEVLTEFRDHLVIKIIQAIYPQAEAAAVHDPRLKELIQYARKVEKEMFEQAQDREEYYHLLAVKIYGIQKELMEKKIEQMKKNARNDAPNMTAADQQAPPNVVIGAPLDRGTTMAMALHDQMLAAYGSSMFASSQLQRNVNILANYGKPGPGSLMRNDSFLQQERMSIKSEERPLSSMALKPDAKPSTPRASSTPAIAPIMSKSKSMPPQRTRCMYCMAPQQQMQGAGNQQRVLAVVYKIQQSRSAIEREIIMNEAKKDPVLFSAVVRELERYKADAIIIP